MGYSGGMGENQKSELHILASATDTKLADLNGRLDRESQKFRQAVEYINKVAGVYEPTTAKEYSDAWRLHMEQQERKQYYIFKQATPEERQKIIDLALEKATPYNKQSVEKMIAELAPKETEINRLLAEIRPLNELYVAHRWQRFFLVTNTNGHVHRSMDCSTTYDTTSWAWLPHLSGLTDKEAVDDQGGILCTHCFPEAPSDYTSGESKAKREGREQRAEEKRVRDEIKLKKKITADGSDVRLKGKVRTYANGETEMTSKTISSITGAKAFLKEHMEFQYGPLPSNTNWTREKYKDGFDGVHTEENALLIASLLSEKTGDTVEKILADAKKRAEKGYQ